MKKILKNFCLLIILLMLFGCEMPKRGTQNYENETVLDTPILILNDNVLSWNEIDNAICYEVYIDNKLVATTHSLSYIIDIEEPGSYTVKVRAVRDGFIGDVFYNNSLYGAIKYKKSILEDVIIEKNDNKLIWNEVKYADGYLVYVNNELVKDGFDVELDISGYTYGNYKVDVIAYSNSSSFIENSGSYNLVIKDDNICEYAVFMINDTHGSFVSDSTPGMACVSTLLNELDSSYEDIIKIANGDLFQGSYVSNVLRGMPIIDSLNYLGFDAFVLGNHEFDWGIEEIYKYYDGDPCNGEAMFPVLGANIFDNRTNDRVEWIDPYTIKEIDGFKVGIIGLMGYGLESSILRDNIVNYRFEEPLPIIKKYAKELKDLGCDSVIVSIHDYDETLNSNIANLSEEYFIDAILCGHTHTNISTSNTRSDGYEIPIVQNKDKNGNAKVVSINITTKTSKVTNYNPSVYSEDSAFKDIIDKYQYIIDEGNEIVGTNKTYKDKAWLGEKVTSIMSSELGAVLGIVNTGGIRATLRSGEVDVASLYEIFPFENKIILVDMNKTQISNYLNRQGDFVYINSDFNLNNLVDNKVYKVAVIDYVYTGAYSSYYFLGLPYQETNIIMRELFINYMKENARNGAFE